MLLRIFWSLCLWWGISSSALAEIHLKDVDGREVTLAAPAQRVYIGFIMRIFGDQWARQLSTCRGLL